MANGDNKKTPLTEAELIAEEEALIAEEEALLVEEEQLFERQQRISQTGLARGETSAIGTIFGTRGAAMSRAAIQADPGLAILGPMAGLASQVPAISPSEGAREAALEGMRVPEDVPMFSELGQDKGLEIVSKIMATPYSGSARDKLELANEISMTMAGGATGQVAGSVADYYTNPALLLTGLVVGLPGVAQGIGETVSKIPGAKPIGRFLTKQRRNPAEFTKDIAKVTRETFVEGRVIPKLENLFKRKLRLYPKEIQRYGMNKGIIKPGMNEYIKNRTVDNIMPSVNNSLDDIAVAKQTALVEKGKLAGAKYDIPFASFSDDAALPVEGATLRLENTLRNHGWIDDVGNVTAEGRAANLPLVKYYEANLSPQSVAQAGNKGNRVLNKARWKDMRNVVQEGRTKIAGVGDDLEQVVDIAHTELESAGVRGLGAARQEWKTYNDVVKANKVVDNEQKLSALFRDSNKVRASQTVDDYLGSDFTRQAQDKVAADALKALQKKALTEPGAEASTIRTNVSKSLGVKGTGFGQFRSSKKAIENIMGKDPLIDDLFKELATLRNVRKMQIGVGTTVGLSLLRWMIQSGARTVASAFDETGGVGGSGGSESTGG